MSVASSFRTSSGCRIIRDATESDHDILSVGAHTIGGMATLIPQQGNQSANETASAKVRKDMTREANLRFDCSWVAHPDLVPLCKEVFDGVLGDRPNQIEVFGQHSLPTHKELLEFSIPNANTTVEGLKNNVVVALRYIATRLSGNGAVAIFGLMEDAATAEIARSQIWQWIHNGTKLDDGSIVTRQRVQKLIDEEAAVLTKENHSSITTKHIETAKEIVETVTLGVEFVEFLTTIAYEKLIL